LAAPGARIGRDRNKKGRGAPPAFRLHSVPFDAVLFNPAMSLFGSGDAQAPCLPKAETRKARRARFM